jgi:hypothetical protein
MFKSTTEIEKTNFYQKSEIQRFSNTGVTEFSKNKEIMNKN